MVWVMVDMVYSNLRSLMRKLFIIALGAAALFTSCKKNVDEPVVNENVQFTAAFENNDTRVYLGEDYYFRWQEGDLLSVFTKDYSHRQYKTLRGDCIKTGLEYVGTIVTSSDALADAHYAIYPYAEGNALAGGKLRGVIAADQVYTSDKVNLNSAVMVAKIPADEKEFYFKNSCALLKIGVAKTDAYHARLNSITVTSKAHKLSGAVSVDIDNDDFTAVIDDTAASNTVKLTGCEDAGMLSGLHLTFYIAIPAGTYEANDLTVTFDCDVDELDCSKTIPTAYTVARSQYLDLRTVLGSENAWFEEDPEKPGIIIKDNATLTNRAIMANATHLERQNWLGQYLIESAIPVPDGDITITGQMLEESGDAQSGTPPVVTHVSVNGNWVMNTFTTHRSGLKGVTPPKVTVKNLTITGEFRTTSMGEYVSDYITAPEKAEQKNFNTEWYNVNVLNAKIFPYNTQDKMVGAAVSVFGTAYLKDCTIIGTEKSEHTDPLWDGQITYYDMACTNGANTIIEGGEIGSIFGWEQSAYTIYGGAKIGLLRTIGIRNSSMGAVTVKDASIGELIMDPNYGTMKPMLTISSEAQISTLRFCATNEAAFKDADYWKSVSISADAAIGKVIVGETEYSLADFLEEYK